MSERQRYVEQMKLKLDQWNQDINDLEHKVTSAGSQMKAEHQENLIALKKKRDEATKKFKELQNTTESAWNDKKDSFEQGWQAICGAVTSAKDKVF